MAKRTVLEHIPDETALHHARVFGDRSGYAQAMAGVQRRRGLGEDVHLFRSGKTLLVGPDIDGMVTSNRIEDTSDISTKDVQGIIMNKPASPSERVILSIKMDAAHRLASVLRRIDVADVNEWGVAVEATLAAGVTEMALSQRLCCSLGTIGRWKSGHSSPGASTRANIRDSMADMIDERAMEIMSRLMEETPEEDETPAPAI